MGDGHSRSRRLRLAAVAGVVLPVLIARAGVARTTAPVALAWRKIMRIADEVRRDPWLELLELQCAFLFHTSPVELMVVEHCEISSCPVAYGPVDTCPPVPS